MQTRERAGEAADGIRDYWGAERFVTLAILVGVDQERTNLRREAFDYMRDERSPVKLDQALVDTAHASTLAAGKHDTGDVAARDRYFGAC
jgi:hypothetical protein